MLRNLHALEGTIIHPVFTGKESVHRHLNLLTLTCSAMETLTSPGGGLLGDWEEGGDPRFWLELFSAEAYVAT